MAEVGQRLGTGVYRLTVLRQNQGRSTVTGESPGHAANGAFSVCRTKEESTKDRRVVPKSRATQREKVYRLRSSESQLEDGTLPFASSLLLEASRVVAFGRTWETLHAHKSALHLPTRLQPLLREKLLFGRMTSWSREAVSSHSAILSSPQQLRAFCTLIFILSEQDSVRSSYRQWKRYLKIHPDPLEASSTCRSYSWRSDSSSKDVPPLYRSRTAYYDILRVSPGATQSQIKTAYYKQSFIHHPDKNPGSDEAVKRFSEISEAYTVLGSISLRRKYDRGILSLSDIHSAGRPSSKETSSRFTGTPHQQQQQQQRARRYSQAGGKTQFDFDAFYRAHYGEQLLREQEMKARKLRMEAMKAHREKENFGRMLEVTVVMMLTAAVFIFANVSKS